MAKSETAVLAGGCFWCLEAVFADLQGVTSVVSGYCGGARPNPSYEQVCAGASGHAEVVQISFDPDIVDFRELLEVFFAIHDPTTPDRQGNDIGSQYRSAIFAQTPEQAALARQVVAELKSDFPQPIVTEINPAAEFWPAEDYHQEYFAQHPRQPDCQAVVAPKLAKFRAKFRSRTKSNSA